MFSSELKRSVQGFTELVLPLSETDLERPWIWKDHDEELHRYEAHFAQHTIQIDKTLAAIEQVRTESKRPLRKIHVALAEIEEMMIGAEKMDNAAILATASSISARTKKIEGLLN